MATAVLAPAWRQVSARVARQVEFGDGHWWLDLDMPAPFEEPRPGQFVQLLLDVTATGSFLPRPMSVAGAAPHDGGWRVSFLYAPVGQGTRSLARLRAGDVVEALGPLGHGFPLEAQGTPVLIAGGRGVAPLLFAADMLARADGARGARRSEFLFGARGAEQLVGLDDARERLSGADGALHVCTDDGSEGMRGNVLQLLEREVAGFTAPIVIHACGPHGMLRAIALWAIAHDVRAHLAMESVMACGTGVCRGCPLPRSAAGRKAWTSAMPSLFGNAEHAMCCTEGPVFEARDLDWEHVS